MGIDDIKTALSTIDYKKIDTLNYSFSDEKETYDYIESILSKCTKKSNTSKKPIKEKLDNIMLNPWLAYPIFFAIMALTFQLHLLDWTTSFRFTDSLLNDSLVPIIEGRSILLPLGFNHFTVIDGIIGELVEY